MNSHWSKPAELEKLLIFKLKAKIQSELILKFSIASYELQMKHLNKNSQNYHSM